MLLTHKNQKSKLKNKTPHIGAWGQQVRMLLVARQCLRVIDSLELNAGPLGLLFLPEDVFRRKTNQLVRIVRIGLRVQVYNSAE